MPVKCRCGCGSYPKRAMRKGRPVEFIRGHHARLYPRRGNQNRYTVDPKTGCWLWTGATTRGYGSLTVGQKRYYAHRFQYETKRGPIPVGAVLDHLCAVPLCVNPDHLEPVSIRENLNRGSQPHANHA